MKFYGLIIILVCSIQAVFGKIIVVSDLDETIKHTTCEVPAWTQTLRRAMFSSKVYSAMPELFRRMTDYSDRLYVLTGSPGIAKPFIWRLIKRNNIPVDWLYTNNWIPFRNTEKHKMRRLHNLIYSYPDHQFILIGDNTSKDVKVYEAINEAYPGRILATYIHKVKPLPENFESNTPTNYFYSAYEIAYAEYVAGRMPFADVEAVHTRLFEDEQRLDELFPHRVHCPLEATHFDHMIDEGLRHFTDHMQERIITYCKNKSLGAN